jgi:hypothetical protein
MTERDAAWMARILARFTPEMVRALAARGDFTDPLQATYLEHVMQGRLDRILDRYLTRLSPMTDVRVEGDHLCAVDLAELRGVRDPARFSYRARTPAASLWIAREPGGRVCAKLSHTGARYLRVTMEDGVATGSLVAHLYDVGDGFKLVGLERP